MVSQKLLPVDNQNVMCVNLMVDVLTYIIN